MTYFCGCRTSSTNQCRSARRRPRTWSSESGGPSPSLGLRHGRTTTLASRSASWISRGRLASQGRALHSSWRTVRGWSERWCSSCSTYTLAVSYTHLRAHETRHDLVCRLLLLSIRRQRQMCIRDSVSGSRFAFLVADGARLERALVQFMLDVHTREHGYTEVWAPMLVNSASMVGTANLPKFADMAFKVEDRDLWLIPTAEVPVTNFHRDEILDGDRLPMKYVAYAPSWRTEAGAAGSDTRGFIRMHQFSKVELVKVTTAETSMEEFEKLVADAEDILRRLGLQYHVLSMCTGDMGFAQYKKYDLEAWAPGLGRHLEVSSCSVFNDFQAMRANIRYRPAKGASPKFAHTINGSGLALPRTIDAIMETYQRSDGLIAVPEVLKPYMGGIELIGAR